MMCNKWFAWVILLLTFLSFDSLGVQVPISASFLQRAAPIDPTWTGLSAAKTEGGENSNNDQIASIPPTVNSQPIVNKHNPETLPDNTAAQDGEPPQSIPVKIPDGRVLNVDVGTDAAAGVIKEKLHSMTGLDTKNDFDLTFEGRILGDDESLETHIVNNGKNPTSELKDNGHVLTLAPRAKVVVQLPSGTFERVNWNPKDTGLELLKAATVQTKLPLERYDLVHGGKPLNLGETLEQQHIDGDSSLQIVQKPGLIVSVGNGRTVEINADPTALPSTVKDQITQKTNIAMTNFNLRFNGKALNDSESLATQGVPYGSSIDLVSKPMLVVHTSKSGDVPLNTSLDANLADVKKQIGQTLNMSASSFEVFARGKLLVEDKTLAEQGIQYGDTLDVRPVLVINFILPDGQEHAMEIEPNGKIVDAQRSLEEVTGLPLDHQQLYHDGVALDSDSTFVSNGIAAGAKLEVRRRKGVSVLTPSGKVVQLELTPDSPPDRVKDVLQTALNIPKEEQILSHDGKVVDDGPAPLKSQGFAFGDQMELIKKPPISVKLPTGDTVPVNVYPKGTVAEVKTKVAEAAWLPVHHFDIQFNDVKLPDGDTLDSHGVVYGQTLDLVRRPSLTILLPDGTTYPLDVEHGAPGSTPAGILEHLQSNLGTSMNGLALFAKRDGGHEELLLDSRSLASQSVPFGAVLHAKLRPKVDVDTSHVVDVRVPNGDVVKVNVALDTTIGSIKQKLQQENTEKFEAQTYDLSFDGKTLADDETIRTSVTLPATLLAVPKMAITAQLPGGELYGLDIKMDTPIATVEKLIETQCKMEVDRQELLYKGRPVPKEGTLSSNGIQFGATIQVAEKPGIIARLPDGGITAIYGSPTMTLEDFKLKLASAMKDMRIKDKHQFCSDDGKVFDEKKTLRENGIQYGSHIDLVKRPGVTVLLSDGRKIPIHLSIDKSPEEIRSAVSEKTGTMLPANSRLEFSRDRLLDGMPLKEQGVANGGLLTLTADIANNSAPWFTSSRQTRDRQMAKQVVFRSHLKEGCNLANDGPKLCANSKESYLMLRQYEQRRNETTLAFLVIMFVLAIAFQTIMTAVTNRVDKSGDRFLRNVLEAIFRQLSLMMLVVSTILICLQWNVIEYKLDHKIFNSVMENFPAMQELFSESHLEMIFDEMLLLAMNFTVVYIASTLYYVLIARDTLSWLKNAENTDSRQIMINKKLHSKSTLVNYHCLRYEFRDRVESTGVPGLDPSGHYFMEYMSARLLKITVELLRIPNSTLVVSLIVCCALFPIGHYRHLKEVLLVLSVAITPLIITFFTLLWLMHLERQLVPKSPLAYLSHRSLVDAGNCAEDMEILHDLGPPYKVKKISRRSCCCNCWTEFFMGTVFPTQHEYIFLFWKRGPCILFRLCEFLFFLQMVVLTNLFYLSDRHPRTWWELYGPWAPITILVIAVLQYSMFPVLLWKLLIVTSTSELIDEEVLREVWEHQRAETIRRSAQFVDQIRMDATIHEIVSGGESYWRRLIATQSMLSAEVASQNAEIFNKLDDDRDGLITPPQFHRWMASQGFTVPNQRELRRWFNTFDHDNKGGINMEEFTLVVLVVKKLLTESIDKEAVQKLFQEKYGVLVRPDVMMTPRTLEGILKEVNLEWRSSQVLHFLEYVSGQRSGEVPVPEFIDKLGILEAETLTTLQQAVNQLRSYPQESEAGAALQLVQKPSSAWLI